MHITKVLYKSTITKASTGINMRQFDTTKITAALRALLALYCMTPRVPGTACLVPAYEPHACRTLPPDYALPRDRSPTLTPHPPFV